MFGARCVRQFVVVVSSCDIRSACNCVSELLTRATGRKQALGAQLWRCSLMRRQDNGGACLADDVNQFALICLLEFGVCAEKVSSTARDISAHVTRQAQTLELCQSQCRCLAMRGPWLMSRNVVCVYIYGAQVRVAQRVLKAAPQ